MNLLPAEPSVSPSWHARLTRLCDATRAKPPDDLASVVRDELRIDLTARYAGITIPHPFGKASGQLSHTLHQIESDVEAGLAFVVLKTVIAEDPGGRRTMEEWATDETKMKVERLHSSTGQEGWTVTWKGRGWGGTLEDYLQFFKASLDTATERDMPVIPSVKYHLPVVGEDASFEEYRHTTQQLLHVWDAVGCGGQMVIEKDLSPTLAGDQRAGDPKTILAWIELVPRVVERVAPGRVRLGIKLLNALFDDRFQLEMLRSVRLAQPRPGYLVVFNRLFDPARQVAFGGWDLSDRNLRVLDQAAHELDTLPPLSGTGNICSGRVMVEYARRGCENGQIHTFFQLPLSEYTATGGNRVARALHTLMLHPTDGIAVWLRHLRDTGVLEERDGLVRFMDVVRHAARQRR